MEKVKYTCEIVVRSSPGILYSFLTSGSSLAQWFCDTCDVNEDVYTFGWEGSEENAVRLEFAEDQYVKYQWEGSDEKEYFDFRISKAVISNETILTITDFAEENEIEDQTMLWESQIQALSSVIGAG